MANSAFTFRKLFIGMRLWARACTARFRYKRALKQFKALEIAYSNEKKDLISHYEKRLEVERTRNETLNQAWADRLLQSQKLAALSVSTTLIEANAASKMPPWVTSESEKEETLTINQNLELQDRKDQFFQDGLALDKSPSEIANRWNDIRDSVIADIRLAVN